MHVATTPTSSRSRASGNPQGLGRFSSTGGFIGAVLGASCFRCFPPCLVRGVWRCWSGEHRSTAGADDRLDGPSREFWPHADVLMYAFPFGWTLGSGCRAHDHVGARSDSSWRWTFLSRGTSTTTWGCTKPLDRGDHGHVLRVAQARRAAGILRGLWCACLLPLGFDFLRHTDMRGADVLGGAHPGPVETSRWRWPEWGWIWLLRGRLNPEQAPENRCAGGFVLCSAIVRASHRSDRGVQRHQLSLAARLGGRRRRPRSPRWTPPSNVQSAQQHRW